MKRDDVIRMAREAGMRVGTNLSGVVLVGSPAEIGLAHLTIEELERFAALVAAAEREEILAYAKSEAFNRMHGERSPYAYELVNYIRARGETK